MASHSVHQHRQQQSTPAPIEAHTTPMSPAALMHQHQFQPGMSLTASSPSEFTHRMAQDDLRSLEITNTGHQPQHHTQVAQQQCQARPGLQQEHFSYHTHFEQEHTSEQYQSQPLIHQLSPEQYRTWQHQQLDAHMDSIMQQKQPQHAVKIERSRSDIGPQCAPYMRSGPDGGNMYMPMSESNGSYPYQTMNRPTSSHSVILDRKPSLQPEWPMNLQRPFTPPLHSSPAVYSPITPAMSIYSDMQHPGTGYNTPAQYASPHSEYNATVKPARRHQSPRKSRPQSQVLQPAINFDYDPNATVKPATQRGSLRGDLFMPNPPQESGNGLPSPPATAPVRHARKFDVTALPDDSPLDDVPKLALLPGNECSMLAFFQPDQSMDGDCALGFAPVEMKQEMSNQGSNFEPQTPSTTAAYHSARSSVDFGAFGSPDKLLMTGIPMSISELSLDAHVSIEDTGISSEEVLSYIQEDPSNSKAPFTCAYPECGKLFGRRENIRSHVQTHLNDRQYRCVHCSKRFVRQHDLKRHSKIHTKEKPYQCACGNGFARQDALTRHRQRGICTGSFEGVVRTPVKRGRPRKNRPNNDDRRDKAARTRKRNGQKAYASSVSGTSESSCFETPSPMLNDMDMDQRNENHDFSLLAGIGNYSSSSFQTGDTSNMLPMSPFQSTYQDSPRQLSPSEANGSPGPTQQLEGYAPSAFQNNQDISSSSNTISMAQLSQASQHGSPRQSHFDSRPGSPPELSHSSPPESARLVDYDVNNNLGADERQATGQIQDDDLARLLSSTETTAGAYETTWADSSFFSLDKDLADGNTTNLASFGDQPLFSDMDDHYS